jgi:hypothetical protein
MQGLEKLNNYHYLPQVHSVKGDKVKLPAQSLNPYSAGRTRKGTRLPLPAPKPNRDVG